MRYRFIFTVAVCAAMAGFASCGSKSQEQQQGQPEVFVAVQTVQPASGVSYNEYPGTVTALNQVQLTPQVSGYVTGIYFQDGQYVHKGQKLYTIDPQVYDANLQNARANLAVQQANLVKAQKDAARYHQLDKEDAIAKQQVDYADATLSAAQKQVEAARATINSVNANVKFTTIYAPFDGTIGISNVRKGQAVVSGQTVLNTISTDNPMAVDFAVDQGILYQFLKFEKQGRAAKNDSTFTLAFGQDIYPHAGNIYLIDRAVDPQTGTIKIRLIFDNPQHLLKAGMNGSVRVKYLNNNTGVATQIPFKAVVEQLGSFYVYVVKPGTSIVNQRQVVLGDQQGDMVVVTKGLQSGETIVTEGQQNLREGAKITTTQPKQPAAGAGK